MSKLSEKRLGNRIVIGEYEKYWLKKGEKQEMGGEAPSQEKIKMGDEKSSSL